jgi:nickel-dependent lactate racemase
MPWFHCEADLISRSEVESLCAQLLEEARVRLGCDFRRVLLLPPDLTRAHSGSGWIAETLYRLLPRSCDVHVIPTLGQHAPHTEAENRCMFGSIPDERIHAHNWRDGVTRVGMIPAEKVAEMTIGKADWAIPIDLNTMLMNEPWDLIINIGQVVPHEVLGFANHNKNYFIGLGGKESICASHMAAAVCGIENNLGKLITPLRACFNWAEEQFLDRLPDVFLQVVMRRDAEGRLVHSGIYVGDDLETYLVAARRSRSQNITVLEHPLKKVVAVMQRDEFRTTWVANKAIYRTRMAMADGGEVLVIAPGVARFGEQAEVDALIRRYGYCGTERVLQLYRKSPDLQDLAHGAAHLIHGSSDGRFAITYAPGGLTRSEIEGVHYQFADLNQVLNRYAPEKMHEGVNTLTDGEKIFFIGTPSAGLWGARERLLALDDT